MSVSPERLTARQVEGKLFVFCIGAIHLLIRQDCSANDRIPVYLMYLEKLLVTILLWIKPLESRSALSF
jgi:hypothetical protein